MVNLSLLGVGFPMQAFSPGVLLMLQGYTSIQTSKPGFFWGSDVFKSIILRIKIALLVSITVLMSQQDSDMNPMRGSRLANPKDILNSVLKLLTCCND